MRGTMLIGILLLICGLAALAWPAISYTDRDKVVDIGPVEVTTTKTKHVPIPPVVGGLAAAAGVVLMISGGRRG